MAASFEKTAIAALESAIQENPMTLGVTVDGQSVTFASLKERQWQLDTWRKELARQAGKRPRVSSIDLSGSF